MQPIFKVFWSILKIYRDLMNFHFLFTSAKLLYGKYILRTFYHKNFF